MATLHSLLALYGALDDAVTTLDDPQVTETVERFLPGTTAPDRRGWFGDIRNFVRRLSVDPDQTEFPTRTEALREFAAMRGAGRDFEVDISPIETIQLLYVTGVHWQLTSRAEEERGLLADALSVAVPGRVGTDSDAASQALLDLLGNDLQSQEGFADVIRAAANHEPPLVSQAVLDYVVNSALEVDVRRDACGEYAVLKAEYFRDELGLDDVKAVIDPLNWHRCCRFFCDMQPIPATPDSYGWSRVLESVSTLCGVVPGYRLKTAIKYWKGERPGGAYINYDVDDNRAKTGDDRYALVDRGYLSFEEDGTGVRIRTLKEVKFAGMHPVATIMFAIVGGYAAIGEDMLVGCAVNPPPNLVAWQLSAATDKPAKPFDPTVCATAPTPCGCQPVSPAFADAVGMWTHSVTEVSTEYAGLVNKWAKSGFQPAEMVDFGAKVSARLATEPWRFWGAMLGSQHKAEP